MSALSRSSVRAARAPCRVAQRCRVSERRLVGCGAAHRFRAGAGTRVALARSARLVGVLSRRIGSALARSARVALLARSARLVGVLSRRIGPALSRSARVALPRCRGVPGSSACCRATSVSLRAVAAHRFRAVAERPCRGVAEHRPRAGAECPVALALARGARLVGALSRRIGPALSRSARVALARSARLVGVLSRRIGSPRWRGVLAGSSGCGWPWRGALALPSP